MRFRGLVAFATLIGSFGFMGWAAAGLTGWNAEPSESATPVTTASLASSSASPQIVAASLGSIALRPSKAAHTTAQPGDRTHAHAAQLTDMSLLSPEPMYVAPQKSDAPVLAYAGPDEADVKPVARAAEKIPMPPRPPAQRARRLVEPAEQSGGLTVAQIGRIRNNLRLTPDQHDAWKPVEDILVEISRDVANQKSARGQIAINPETSQRLYWAAGPLLMSLREDQRQEARNLARSMGLEKVASLI